MLVEHSVDEIAWQKNRNASSCEVEEQISVTRL